jgi:hypothetical protein
VGRSPIGIHGGSGVRIFVPPDLFEKKAKIPAPVYCVVPIKVGKAEVVPMSALPPPGICNGIQQQALVNAVGSQSGNAAGKVAMYCISCKYGFLNWKGKPHPIHVNYLDGVGQGKGSQSLINKVLQCYRCQSNYVWNAAKGKCCKNPNK